MILSDSQMSQELVLRRLESIPSELVLLFPVAFAFMVLFIVLFFRQRETLADWFRLLYIPAWIPQLLGGIWSLLFVGLLAGVLGFIVHMSLDWDWVQRAPDAVQSLLRT